MNICILKFWKNDRMKIFKNKWTNWCWYFALLRHTMFVKKRRIQEKNLISKVECHGNPLHKKLRAKSPHSSRESLHAFTKASGLCHPRLGGESGKVYRVHFLSLCLRLSRTRACAHTFLGRDYQTCYIYALKLTTFSSTVHLPTIGFYKFII